MCGHLFQQLLLKQEYCCIRKLIQPQTQQWGKRNGGEDWKGRECHAWTQADILPHAEECAKFNSVPEMKQKGEGGKREGERGIWGLGVELIGCTVYATQCPHIQQCTRCTEEVEAQMRADDYEGGA